jgi:hypothetical protein
MVSGYIRIYPDISGYIPDKSGYIWMYPGYIWIYPGCIWIYPDISISGHIWIYLDISEIPRLGGTTRGNLEKGPRDGLYVPTLWGGGGGLGACPEGVSRVGEP